MTIVGTNAGRDYSLTAEELQMTDITEEIIMDTPIGARGAAKASSQPVDGSETFHIQ